MGKNEAGILVEIARMTQSELVAFFIILAVVFIVSVVPIYALLLKNRRHRNQLENERLSQYVEREKRIIEVITANTTTAAELKMLMIEVRTTLESDRVTFKESLDRIHNMIDRQCDLCTQRGEAIMRVSTALDEVLKGKTGVKTKYTRRS